VRNLNFVYLSPSCDISVMYSWISQIRRRLASRTRFLNFSFRSINVGAVMGQNLPFPIDKAHCLYSSLLLLHKPIW